MEQTAGEIISRYRIISLIGEAGVGLVYLAEHTKLHRKISLKFLSTNVTQDDERLRRFEQEARAVSALNHPNIITIHEIAEEEGHQFTVGRCVKTYENLLNANVYSDGCFVECMLTVGISSRQWSQLKRVRNAEVRGSIPTPLHKSTS